MIKNDDVKMAKKGGSKHLKRLPAPASWPIHRKEHKWVVKPKPGPHSLSKSLPLLLVLRDILGLAKNRKEAMIMLSGGQIRVNGKIRRRDDYSIGFFDVIEIPAIQKVYRIILARKRLQLQEIEGDEREFKLCKIVGKTTVKGGHLQLHVHDGNNILLKISDRKNPIEDIYSIYDVLRVGIPSYEILAHLKFEEGVLGIIERGKRAGTLAEVTKIVKGPRHKTSSVALRDSNGNLFETILNNVFPIGKGDPWIKLPEEDQT